MLVTARNRVSYSGNSVIQISEYINAHTLHLFGSKSTRSLIIMQFMKPICCNKGLIGKKLNKAEIERGNIPMHSLVNISNHLNIAMV